MRVITNIKKQNKNSDSPFLQVLCFVVLTESWLILLKMKRLGRQGINELTYPTPASASSHDLLLPSGGKAGLLSK